MIDPSEIITSDKIQSYIDTLPSKKYIYYKLYNDSDRNFFNTEKLILGTNCDITKTISERIFNNSLCKKIYSPNAASDDVEPLPLGMLEDNISFLQNPIQNQNKNKLCYLNINPFTYEPRKLLINYFSNFDWVTIEEPLYTLEGKEHYFKQLSSYNFVMCPRGRTIDTHRLWETLYAGSIPIVIYENCFRTFTDLPILFINDWSIVTKELLESTLIEFKARTWNVDRLRLKYWLNLITMIDSNIHIKLSLNQTPIKLNPIVSPQIYPPKIYFITFGTHNYTKSLERVHKEAAQLNTFDKIIIYTENDFDEKFFSLHKDFMQNNRGYGFWIWKPYFLKKTFEMMNHNDILIYADAGCTLVNTPKAKQRLTSYIELVRMHRCGNISFEMDFLEGAYTKMDVLSRLDTDLNLLNDMAMTKQLVGGIFIMRKNDLMIKLIDHFNTICSDYSMIDDSPSIEMNLDIFKTHRHDQSIFSILRKKYGSIKIPDDTWYENFNTLEASDIPILATRIK